MEDNTAPGTLWSRTLIDLLLTAVQRHDGAEVNRLLRSIKSRGLRKREVLLAARSRLNAGQLAELEKMIKGMGRAAGRPPADEP